MARSIYPVSIFPKKLKPGGTVTLHRRAHAKAPAWYHLRHSILFPDGNEVSLGEGPFFCCPQPGAPEEHELLKQSDHIFQAPPLLMASRYLESESRNQDFFLDALVGLRDASHFYSTYTLPSDSPLGRYRYKLEFLVNGVVRESATADADFFFVEKLELENVVYAGLSREATVLNPSPEPVVAVFHEYHDEGGTMQSSRRLVEMAAHGRKQFSFTGFATLSYLGGTETLFLKAEEDPLCLRNPAYRTLKKSNSEAYAFDSSQEVAYEFRGLAAAIWTRADGFHTRAMLRTSENESAYDELKAQGHLVEL